MNPESVFDTFPWPQFDASPSAVRRDIVVESPAKNSRSSAGATSSDYAAPDGAKSKFTTAGYKDAAPDGASTQNTVLSRDAIAKIDAVATAALDTAVLAPWSSTGDGNSATQADHSTGRAAYGFNAKKDLPAQLPALNQQVAANIEKCSPV